MYVGGYFVNIQYVYVCIGSFVIVICICCVSLFHLVVVFS